MTEPRTFRTAARAAIAAATFIGAIAAGPVQDHVQYFLINGPDYRQVSAAAFNDERSSCLRIVRRDYPADHITQWQCYI